MSLETLLISAFSGLFLIAFVGIIVEYRIESYFEKKSYKKYRSISGSR